LGSNQQILQEFDIALKHVSKIQNKFIDAFKSIVLLTNAGSFEFKFITNKPGYVSKLTDKVADSQLSTFQALLNSAILEIDINKKKMFANSLQILFGFSQNEINSMIYGSDPTNIGK
jgi:hypothetical protein